MIKLLGNTQIKKIKNNMKFFDFNELNSYDNSNIVIKFNKKIENITYSDILFGHDEKIFDFKKETLIEFTKKVIENVLEQECIILKYNEKWIVNKEKSYELFKVLDNFAIKNTFNGGILVDKNSEIVSLFIESVLKYNSFIELIFVDLKLIISPTDHMDIFFHSDNLVVFKELIESTICEWKENILTYEFNN